MAKKNANQIASYRKLAGFKQKAFADLFGWSQARLANYESNRRTPTIHVALQIFKKLKELKVECGIEDLFPIEDKAPDRKS